MATTTERNHTTPFVLTIQLLKKIFSNWDLKKGLDYCERGRVTKITVSSDSHVYAQVEGTQRVPYEVDIKIDTKKSWPIHVDGFCSCPVGYNCKHVIAALFESINLMNSNKLSAPARTNVDKNDIAWRQWLTDYQQSSEKLSTKSSSSTSTNTHRIIYLIDASKRHLGNMATVSMKVLKCLKKGGYGKPRNFQIYDRSYQQCLTESDHEILHELRVMDSLADYNVISTFNDYLLYGRHAAKLLEKIVGTGRAYWQEITSPLSQGRERLGQLVWKKAKDEQQQLILKADDHQVTFIPMEEAWYYDPKSHECGPLTLSIPTVLLAKLLEMPAVTPKCLDSTHDLQIKAFSDMPLCVPTPSTLKIVDHLAQKITPILRLYGESGNKVIHHKNSKAILSNLSCCIVNGVIPLAELEFDYDGMIVKHSDSSKNIVSKKEGNLHRIPRNFDKETASYEQLMSIDLATTAELRESMFLQESFNHSFVFNRREDLYSLAHMITDQFTQWEASGWSIRIDESFPVQFIATDDAWYTELEESDYNWFGLELGITVNDKKINLLPILVHLLQNQSAIATAIRECDDDSKLISIIINHDQAVRLPAARVKKILQVLSDLHQPTALDQENKLRLSKLRALDMLDLEHAFSGINHRWLGTKKIHEYAKKLAHFSSPKPVKIPAEFKATLRAYQHEGVNWLQFLREYGLGGILADDMGLGKTVQFLANLLIEKLSKRTTGPSLLILPTSLVFNWQAEVKRFAPALQVLVIHGKDRHHKFSQIENYDLVITTYSLVLRDQSHYLDKTFYYLVLDEAQYIKNTKTKSYQTILQINTSHRLCLTGTPMENHLGECWAIFNQVLPGFLGDSKQFSQLFRTPIEKHDDRSRSEILAKRVKPFLLRRTKNAVLKDLPEKSIIVQTVNIEGEQADLYEIVRVSMQKEIKKIINVRGISRSQIFILDAILKLRQICCDPRIVNIKAGKNMKTSAKLNFLINMLTNAVAEGRRIIVYSSFIKMLKLIENELKAKNIPCTKLTGSTKNRGVVINQFQQGEFPVFLISLKAGGVGLNLTAADTVIHYDPWWNPAAEDQATDRAHRIGQTKNIFVYKLICHGTIEETILGMQERKRKILDSLLTPSSNTKLQLTKNDIDELFKPIETAVV